MRIGNRDFDVQNHTYVMGILNVTPDSFSDGGRYSQLDEALFQVERMVQEGADIIDVGGESTRPGYTQISILEEVHRTAPVIEAVKKRFEVPVSLDTYKASVADAGIMAGADMINDIWGLKYDREILPEQKDSLFAGSAERMADVIQRHAAVCCLMHNRNNTEYEEFIPDVCRELLESADLAAAAGISRDQIILDPGVGFGKTYEQNLMTLNCLERFCALGYPILLGTSKKSVIGLTLDLPTEERGAATIATTAMAVMKGCAFVRVHDVKENVQAVKMLEAIRNRI